MRKSLMITEVRNGYIIQPMNQDGMIYAPNHETCSVFNTPEKLADAVAAFYSTIIVSEPKNPSPDSQSSASSNL